MEVLVIAEIGVNHNGDISLAKEMIDAACKSGADVVKFQTYIADEVMTDKTPLAGYMGDSDDNFLDLARRLELSIDETIELKAYTEARGAEFMSSPFDVPSTIALAKLGLQRLKIPSGETVNPFVMKAAAETGLPLIVSTGMCTLSEVEASLNFLKEHNSGPVTLLHCTTQYPAAFENLNLRAMLTLEEKFGAEVGYSDHTPGIEASLAAVALGATVIEKHFTTDRTLPGPDQAASLIPSELKDLVDATRNISKSLGDGKKEPKDIELEIAKVARKSLVAKSDLAEGTVLSWDNVTAKRPGTGIAAWDFLKYEGKILKHNIKGNSLITVDDICD